MELFSIICETCQAKLRVRQPEAIGQILECPRCQSMVQVVPPPDWTSDSDSPETTAADDRPDSGADGQAVEQPFLPEVPQAYSLRTIWIAVAAGAGLLAIAIGLATAWLRSGGTDPIGTATAATAAPAPQGPSNPIAVPPESAAPDDSQPPPRPDRPNAPSPEAAPSDSAGETTAAPPAEQATPDPAATEASEGGPPAPATDRPEPDAATADVDGANDSASPANSDDSQTSNDNDPAPASEQPIPTSPPSVPEPPPEQPAAPSPAVPALPPPAAKLHTADRADGMSQPIDVRARLADPVRQIDFDAVPLSDLVNLLVEMTRLPITLDLDALERKGLHATTPVSIHLRDASVADILTEAVTQRGLTYAADDHQVVITDSPSDRAVVRYRVVDLVPSGSPAGQSAGLQQLANQIETLIAPATWRSAGGDGTIEVNEDLLAIDQSRETLYQILVFCEKLRLARGLPLKGRLPASRFPLASRTARAGAKLDRPVTVTFLEPTPLTRVVQYIQHASDLTIIIDWRLLLAEGLTPNAAITCGVTDKPLREALTTLLSPLGLDWRAVNADTIQLVTQADADRRLEVEFYSIGDHLRAAGNPQRLVDRLCEEVGSDSWTGTGGKGVVVYDPPGGRVIVLQTQPIQRQVEAWLRNLIHPRARGGL